MLSLFFQAIFLGLLPSAINNQNENLVLASAFIISFFYGMGFGIIPSFLADQFGAKNVGATHGMILTAWSIAGVAGGLVFTAVYNQQKNELIPEMGSKKAMLYLYNINFEWILAFVIFGMFLALMIPTNFKDRKLPSIPNECCRFRCFNKLIRCITLSNKDLEVEWKNHIDYLKNRFNKNRRLGTETELIKINTNQQEINKILYK